MARTGFALGGVLPLRDVIAAARAAEERGYDSFWLTEGTARDAISQLGAVAVSTRSIRLGTAILNIYSRSAALMALTAASLNELSGGRFTLGLGTGHKNPIEGNHGVPWGKPLARMRDYVTIIKRALRDREVTYQGAAHSAPNLRLTMPQPQPDVPVYIATLGSGMAQLAGEVADGVLPLMTTPEGIKALVASVREGAQRAGKDPGAVDVACLIIACASSDQRAAEAEARRQVARYASMPHYQSALKLGGFPREAEVMAGAWADGDGARAAGLVSDAMLESLTLLGTPQRWQRTVDRFRAAGVTHPIVYAVPVGEDGPAAVLQAVATGGP